MRKTEYERYLRSPHWQAVRKQKLDIAGRRCSNCKTTDAQLHVHHLTYERVGRERLSDLAVLCNICHMEAHGLLNGLEPVIRTWQIIRGKPKKGSTLKPKQKKRIYATPKPKPNPNDELHRRQVEIRERKQRAADLRTWGL